MTSEATPFPSEVVGNSSQHASLRTAPVQLRESVHTFLSLAKLHPDLHPAVLAAILARPAGERRSLLEAARAAFTRASTGSASDSSCAAEQKPGKADVGVAASPTATMCSDSDEVWEDAVEDLDPAVKKQRVDAVDMATVVVGGGSSDLDRLVLEAADSRRAWQETRQLGAWTRYTECRKKVAELRNKERCQGRQDRQDEERTQREAKWSQLEALREVHEGRLAELNRRRERLRLSRQYHEQTRLHHAQLAQAQLQEQLRQLEERQQLRRLQHLQRVQQLVEEVAVLDRDRQPSRPSRRTQSVSSAPSTSSPSPPPDDVFTHMWDDFSHWEKMVSDDKENVDPAVERGQGRQGRPASCSTMTGCTLSSFSNSVGFSNQPDLIPVMPSSAAGAGVWRHKSVGSPHVSRRQSVAADSDGFEERKKWFERALLSWRAQDDEEHFGTSLYASHASSARPEARPRMEAIGGGRSSRSAADCGSGRAPKWHNAAWSAWTAPVTY